MESEREREKGDFGAGNRCAVKSSGISRMGRIRNEVMKTKMKTRETVEKEIQRRQLFGMDT